LGYFWILSFSIEVPELVGLFLAAIIGFKYL